MSKQSIGLIETVGLVAAIEAADAAVKSANVELIGYELSKGGMTVVKVGGDVGAVNAAIAAAAASASRVNGIVSIKVIPRPSDSIAPLIVNEETVGAVPPSVQEKDVPPVSGKDDASVEDAGEADSAISNDVETAEAVLPPDPAPEAKVEESAAKAEKAPEPSVEKSAPPKKEASSSTAQKAAPAAPAKEEVAKEDAPAAAAGKEAKTAKDVSPSPAQKPAPAAPEKKDAPMKDADKPKPAAKSADKKPAPQEASETAKKTDAKKTVRASKPKTQSSRKSSRKKK
ncbi:MAG: BMC domain-containing protein [Desulfovibrio sp.]|uniref:BMC domain-containing protein n=1 Tax=Desulfovibrio sp. 7SRBS1 TaxID=3378064 RepID=UPI003B3BEF95